jgi:DNA-binding CsgD family transcriptional regulator
MEYQTELRPLERAVLRLFSDGVSTVEIGRRFRRSPAHIERVIRYAALPHRRGTDRPGLRPIERRVLAWRAAGLDHQELAVRFKRGAGHMRRIEGLAHLRKARELLA